MDKKKKKKPKKKEKKYGLPKNQDTLAEINYPLKLVFIVLYRDSLFFLLPMLFFCI